MSTSTLKESYRGAVRKKYESGPQWKPLYKISLLLAVLLLWLLTATLLLGFFYPLEAHNHAGMEMSALLLAATIVISLLFAWHKLSVDNELRTSLELTDFELHVQMFKGGQNMLSAHLPFKGLLAVEYDSALSEAVVAPESFLRFYRLTGETIQIPIVRWGADIKPILKYLEKHGVRVVYR